jgi:hypothetical protein
MTAAAWLAAVARRGGTYRLDERRRVCVRPSWALTPALRAAFPQLQATLVAVLGELAGNPAQERPGSTLADVLTVFPGARVGVADQPAIWPPAEITEPTTDALVPLARAKGLPCLPLAPGVTILGTDWAWQAFAATASRPDRAKARAYLEWLPAPEEGHPD